MDRDRPLRETPPTAQAQPTWQDELVPVASEMAKTAGLFLQGKTGMALTVAAYAFGEVLDDCKGKMPEEWNASDMYADALRGTAKGGLMKASFAGLSHLKTGIFTKGVVLGESSRFVDSLCSKSTYDSSVPLPKGSLIKTGSQPLDKILNTTFDPLAMASDGVVFVAGHGMFKGLQKVNKSASDRPFIATVLTGGTFGMAGGAAGEILRQKQDNEDLDLGKVLGSGLKRAAMDAVASMPAGFQADKQLQVQVSEVSKHLRTEAIEHGKRVGEDVSNMSRRAAREARWRYWEDIAKIKPKEMKLTIPDEITTSPEWLAGSEAVTTLRGLGYKAYFVGGCVRDILLNKIPKDFDVVTNAPPHVVNQTFPDGPYAGKSFAVKHASINGITIEIATFRCDGKYVDGKPVEVIALDKLPINIAMREDAGRRDFIFNTGLLCPVTHTMSYFFDVPGHLIKKTIETVQRPKTTFGDDPSRMLRVAAFASRLEGFKPTPRVVQGMADNAKSIHRSSNTLWGRELGKMLMGDDPVTGLMLLKETGLIKEMIPELELLDSPAGDQDPIHHSEGNTWNHILMVTGQLAKSPKRNTTLMFSGLLHDIGKPKTQVRGDDGRITNYKHESVGGKLIEPIGEQLGLPKFVIADIKLEVEKHMAMHNGPKMTDATLYKYLNLPNIENLIELQHADALGRGQCCAPVDATEAVNQGNAGSQRQFWEAALQEARHPAEVSRAIDARPILDGKELKLLGYKQGIPLGEIIAAAKWAQFKGEFTDLEGAVKWLSENCEPAEQSNIRSDMLNRERKNKKAEEREQERLELKRERQERKRADKDE